MLSNDGYFVPTGGRPMLARILHPSPKLCAFLDQLIESLSKPQRAHLRELCDAALVCETDHTLTAMQLSETFLSSIRSVNPTLTTCP
jgi:hypothetical protein